MSVQEIFLFILILVGIGSCIYLVVTLKKINVALDVVRKDLANVNEKLGPILDNVKFITDKAVSISDETEKRVLDIGNTLQNVRNTVSKFSFSSKGSSSTRSPIQDLLGNLTAVSKGVSAFWQKLNN